MSAEGDFLTQKLAEHASVAMRAEIDDLKAQLSRIKGTLDTTIFPNGGDVAWPFLAPEGGDGTSSQQRTGSTRTINVFADGTLESLEVVTEGGSSFGPF